METMRTGSGPEMLKGMTKLIGGAVGAVTGLVRHLAWYVSHQVQPDPRRRDAD
jgi:hypothetical protein